MDQTGAAFVRAVEPYGLPALLLVGGVFAILVVSCYFLLPAWRKNMDSAREIEEMKARETIKLEREREHRKAEESRMRNENDQERAKIDSRTATILEGIQKTMDALVITQERLEARLDSSSARSSHMGDTVEDTNRKVTEIHHVLMKEA